MTVEFISVTAALSLLNDSTDFLYLLFYNLLLHQC